MVRILVFLTFFCAAYINAVPTKSQRNNGNSFVKQEESFATTEPPEAPYAASGFRPSRAFNLPTEDEEVNGAEFSPETTGVPADSYGPPEESTTTVNPVESENTENPDSEVEDLARSSAESSVREAAAEIPDGLYYVQLPNGIQQILVGIPETNKMAQNIQLAQLLDTQSFVIAPNAPQSYTFLSPYQSW